MSIDSAASSSGAADAAGSDSSGTSSSLSLPSTIVGHIRQSVGLLASGSVDATIKLWDVLDGKCAFTLARHAHPVSCLAFAPPLSASSSSSSMVLLASAAYDRLHLWSVRDGVLLRTFKTNGAASIDDVAFDSTGAHLALAVADGSVVVIALPPPSSSSWLPQQLARSSSAASSSASGSAAMADGAGAGGAASSSNGLTVAMSTSGYSSASATGGFASSLSGPPLKRVHT